MCVMRVVRVRVIAGVLVLMHTSRPLSLSSGQPVNPLPLSSHTPAASLQSQELIDWHMVHDIWGAPGALGWGHNMRWGSAVGLLSHCASTESELGQMEFPVLVMHDPNDKVVDYEGSLLLMERSLSRKKVRSWY